MTFASDGGWSCVAR